MARIAPAELTLFDLRKSWFNLLLRLFVRLVALLAPPLLCSHNKEAMKVDGPGDEPQHDQEPDNMLELEELMENNWDKDFCEADKQS